MSNDDSVNNLLLCQAQMIRQAAKIEALMTIVCCLLDHTQLTHVDTVPIATLAQQAGESYIDMQLAMLALHDPEVGRRIRALVEEMGGADPWSDRRN